MTSKHLERHSHIPLCPESLKCKDFQKQIKPHCDCYRHCAPSCPHGIHCVDFHDGDHIRDYSHPFIRPCPFTPYHCKLYDEFRQKSVKTKLSNEVEVHCSTWSHVCPRGRLCDDKTEAHLKVSIHVARCLCKYGDNCNRLMDEDHLNSCTHPKIPDIRLLCTRSNCDNSRNPSHRFDYRHKNFCDYKSVVPYDGLNTDKKSVQNQNDKMTRSTNCTQNNYGKPLHPQDAQDMNFRGNDQAALQSTPTQGACMVIPCTNFKSHTVLRLTISQAFDEYRNKQQKRSADNTTFIYWQAMNGDMMLTLSNDLSESEKSPSQIRHLICYLAEKPESRSTSYHESPSYINSVSSLKNSDLTSNQNYAAQSNRFYVGCNTDDFMTFCLEIQRSTGKITLSHAGPNSIYNHAQISYIFGKTELDLSQLEFIQISAGTHQVPFRNLQVCFERQAHLHPVFDKNFSKSSTGHSKGLSDAKSHQRNDKHGPPLSHNLDHGIAAPVDVFSTMKGSSHGHGGLSLTPCRDGTNCRLQFSSDGPSHNSNYSHPCRFSELCQEHEPHLTHEPHRVPQCRDGGRCNKLTDPIHRMKYRHTDLPDFLIPCSRQETCRDISDTHRMKYSHGEIVHRMHGATASAGKEESIL